MGSLQWDYSGSLQRVRCRQTEIANLQHLLSTSAANPDLGGGLLDNFFPSKNVLGEMSHRREVQRSSYSVLG